MELEELKTVWASVDERLKKQEIMKESIIREIISVKINKSLNKLFWTESIGIPILLLLIPLIVYQYGKFGGKHILWDSIVIFAGVFCVVYLPFLIYRIYLLMKIDISGNIKNNLFYLNRYNIQIKREKYGMAFIGPLIFIFGSLWFIEIKAKAPLWALWICMLIFLTLLSYWSYNKFYNKNIQSIQKNLEELEELKELNGE